MNIYKIGETIDQKEIVKTGSLYRVRGWVDSETQFEGFETHSLLEARRCQKKLNKTGAAIIYRHECCFDCDGELHVADEWEGVEE